MAISLRLNENDVQLIKAYASMHGKSVSEFIRTTVLDRIEEEHDIKAYETAMAEYKKDPVSFSHKDILQMLAAEEE